MSEIAGVVAKPLVRRDDGRGYFEELVRASEPVAAPGIRQISFATRAAGVVTAWHIHPTQWDWWFVPRGSLRVALHDLRAGSATFRVTQELALGEGAPDALLAIPPGVAHGYKVLNGPAEILYLVSTEYNDAHPAPPQGEEGRIPADDPDIGYDWNRP